MAVAFKRGSTTGPADLLISVRDSVGTLIDPYRLEYAVYDATTGIEVLMGSLVNTPVRISTGQYYAQVVIPADANIGNWLIRWTIQEISTDPVYQSVQPFNVVGDSTIVSFTGDANVDKLLYSLRTLLRDNNPDRNYSFRPPSKEKFIQGQTQVFGFVWEDEELLEYIYMAIDDFNTRPPVTGLFISDLWGSMKRWRTAILLRGAAFACFAAMANWIVDEFSVDGKEMITVKDQNDKEYSLTIKNLFELISGYVLKKTAQEAKKQVQEALSGKNFLKLFWIRMKSSIIEVVSGFKKVSVTDNALIQAYSMGSLKVRSMIPNSTVPKWVPLKQVLKHHTPHKRMFRIDTAIGSVKVSEDHSLFIWNTKEPIRAAELEHGDMVVGLPGKEFEPVKVIGSTYVGTQEFTYDVSVPGTENAVLDSGILIHNSYSISGVSLEIDKSSKYQSLKDEFISEYDKVLEAAKRSIKTIMGLKQQKYGVGLQSALGPLSRPGDRKSVV